MKLSSSLLFVVAGLSAFSFGQKEKIEHPWLVRVRALNMLPANKSDAFTALGVNFPSNAVNLTNKLFPEVDVTYFFTKNIAAELVLTYPQKHNVNLNGFGQLGNVTHLPPTLSVQYHFVTPNSSVTPYVGLGLNYTKITSANLSAGGVALDVKRDSFGLAFGAGLDFKINETWSLNFDFKHVNIGTDVKVVSTGATLTKLDINPNLISIGVGYRF